MAESCFLMFHATQPHFLRWDGEIMLYDKGPRSTSCPCPGITFSLQCHLIIFAKRAAEMSSMPPAIAEKNSCSYVRWPRHLFLAQQQSCRKGSGSVSGPLRVHTEPWVTAESDAAPLDSWPKVAACQEGSCWPQAGRGVLAGSVFLACIIKYYALPNNPMVPSWIVFFYIVSKGRG